MLGLLESVKEDGRRSQRVLAADLGIALGLVNVYLKRCVKMGFIKVRHVPARRYAYYLTPRGFAEKSRLTAEYLSYSLSMFRQARRDFLQLMRQARESGCRRIALVGASDLAEIAVICALESDMAIVGIIDPASERARVAGIPVVETHEDLQEPVEKVILTDPAVPEELIAALIGRFEADSVLVPALIGVRPNSTATRSPKRKNAAAGMEKSA